DDRRHHTPRLPLTRERPSEEAVMPVYTFTTLNDPLATDGTLAHGINGSGQIVGQYANNNTGINRFLLSGGTYTTIPDPFAPQHRTQASANNAAGRIAGIYVPATNGDHGFLSNPTNGTYTTLDDPSATNGTAALGINDRGQIVGLYITGGGLSVHGFL